MTNSKLDFIERLVELNNSKVKSADAYIMPNMLKNFLANQKEYIGYTHFTPYDLARIEKMSLHNFHPSLPGSHVDKYNVDAHNFLHCYKYR
jgi:hypothetical protein